MTTVADEFPELANVKVFEDHVFENGTIFASATFAERPDPTETTKAARARSKNFTTSPAT
jgi:hypothetical protein